MKIQENALFSLAGEGGGGQGGKRTPKSFDLVKIRAKFFKILAESVKFWAKSLKVFTKQA